MRVGAAGAWGLALRLCLPALCAHSAGAGDASKDLAVLIDALLAANREGIASNRTAVIRLQAPPGATVSVKQVRHQFQFGTAIKNTAFVPNDRMNQSDQEQYKRVLKENFNSAVHENAMKWYSNERVRDEVTFADADAMLAWCDRNGFYTRGHCVFWGRDDLVQPWIKELDDAALRAKLQERAKVYMQHFKGRVPEHDVNNEMLHCHYFANRLGREIRKQMFEWCHAYDPDARLYVNDYSILSGGDTGRYVEQIKGFLAAGMPVGGIGVQGHMGGNVSAESIKTKLDLLARFGLPIKVTEFDANTKDEEAKARVLATLYVTAFAHPAVEGIYMWGFWEKAHWRPDAALWNADWTETPAARTYRELVFRRWWTDFDGVADAAGDCEVRVFFGEHEVTVDEQSRHVAIGPRDAGAVIDCRPQAPLAGKR